MNRILTGIPFCNQEYSLRRPTTSLEAGTRGMAREKAIVVLGATGNQGSCVLKHLHAAETPNVGRVDESVLCWLRSSKDLAVTKFFPRR
jgi:hypothetical protein